ncbi:MAG: hypothetical protein ACI9NQ_001813, partial [Paracoccaceae bacterium]
GFHGSIRLMSETRFKKLNFSPSPAATEKQDG